MPEDFGLMFAMAVVGFVAIYFVAVALGVWDE